MVKSDRQFGDFQTPPELVGAILELLGPIADKWDRVLEPTCGRGNFIEGIIKSGSVPEEIVGIEVKKHHVELAKKLKPPQGTRITILEKDIFHISLLKDIHWEKSGSLLVIGNPPWVTNAEIGSLKGNNLPKKVNLKKLKGLDAITGGSNFDITEYILIKLIKEFVNVETTIALLCKTVVARNVLQFAEKFKLPISDAEIRKIDAKKWFNAAVDACLFILHIGLSNQNYHASVFNSLEDSTPMKNIGFVNGRIISDVSSYDMVSSLDGESQLEW